MHLVEELCSWMAWLLFCTPMEEAWATTMWLCFIFFLGCLGVRGICYHPRNINTYNGKHNKHVCVCLCCLNAFSLCKYMHQYPNPLITTCAVQVRQEQQVSFHTRCMPTIHTIVLTCSFSCCLWQAKLACTGILS